MQTVSMEFEDSFYNDLVACALAGGYSSLEECFMETVKEKVTTYRLTQASQGISINTNDFPSL